MSRRAAPAPSNAGTFRAPRFQTCYLCGQQFGSSSLAIHQPQCYRKKLVEWENMPPEFKGPRPTNPASFAGGGDDGGGFQTSNGGGGRGGGGAPIRGRGRGNAGMGGMDHQANNAGASNGRPTIREMNMGAPPPDAQAGLYPCPHCGRTFTGDRVQRHANVCQGQRKRRVFNSQKHRLEGTEAAGMIGRVGAGTRGGRGGGGRGGGAPAPSKWRQQHQEFQRAIRDARQISRVQARGGNLASLPPPKPTYNPDYVQCPHCGRRFAQQAAERHIPSCANTINRPRPPPRSVGPSASSGAGRGGRGSVSRQSQPTIGGGYPGPNSIADYQDVSPGRLRPRSAGSSGRGNLVHGSTARGRGPLGGRGGPSQRVAGPGRGGSGGGFGRGCSCGAAYVTDAARFCQSCGKPR